MNAVFICLLGAVHVYISLPAVYVNIWLVRIDQGLLFISGCSLLLVAVAHVVAISQNIIQSIVQRRLSFVSDDASDVARQSVNHTAMVKLVCVPVERLKRLIGERGLFGVYGDYFYAGFYARQAVEIVMQTYQAYQFSLSVSRDWINGLVMMVVVTNCLFVPVVNYRLRHDPGGRRATLLTIDLLLDFVLLVVIPLVTMIPYALQFDWANARFDPVYTYDDIWFTTVVSEVRQSMISSELDFLSTLFPHVAGLFTLDTIKGLIEQSHSDNRLKATPRDTALTIAAPTSTPDKPRRLVQVATPLFHTFCFGWLTFVLSIHGKAQLLIPRTKSSACSLRGNAWFASRETCYVAEVNCHRSGFQGDRHEITTILESLEVTAVSRLIFSHCQALHMPRIITEFASLASLEIFNSTLVDWPHDAALSSRTTPDINQLHFLATNFTQFPSALLRRDLPTRLGMIIYQSNISELPVDIGVSWESHVWQYFQVEYSKLTVLPTSFAQVRSARLSFVYNQIESFEDSVFASSTILTSLRLSGNKLTVLPDVPGSIPELYQIVAEDTNIAVLPVWFTPWFEGRRSMGKSFSVSLRGSPLCDGAVSADICAQVPLDVSGDLRFDLISKLRML